MIHRKFLEASESTDDHRDPSVDGPDVFKGSPPRLRIACACVGGLLEPKELAAVSRQDDANARTSALTLTRYGVLIARLDKKGKRVTLTATPRWRPAIEEARRASLAGCLQSDQRLLLLDAVAADSFFKKLADRDRPDRRLMWMVRAPDSKDPRLLVALDPELSEDDAIRLDAELRQNGIEAQTLTLGRSTDFSGIRRFAADSLPGAYAAEDG